MRQQRYATTRQNDVKPMRNRERGDVRDDDEGVGEAAPPREFLLLQLLVHSVASFTSIDFFKLLPQKCQTILWYTRWKLRAVFPIT